MFDKAKERTAASFGASVGASLGRGPVSAGVAAGFGGAIGYVAGALTPCGCGGKKLVPDGGTNNARAAAGRDHAEGEPQGRISIPVEDTDDR